METNTDAEWMTIKMLAKAEPAFSQAAIRALVFAANDRQTSKGLIRGNGLAPHIRRIGRRVLVDRRGFRAWIASKNAHKAA